VPAVSVGSVEIAGPKLRALGTAQRLAADFAGHTKVPRTVCACATDWKDFVAWSGTHDRQAARGLLRIATGAHAAGTDLPPANPSATALRHHLLVADLAEWLVATHAGATWLTKRELRARAMSTARDVRTGRLIGGVPHAPDGCLVVSDGRRIAVELECSPKRGSRYGVVLRHYAIGEFDAMRWFVESKALRKRLADLVTRELVDDLISVEALPEALWASSWARLN
jgi:hypothetical protein